MINKYRFLRIAGIIFGLVIPLLFTLVYLLMGIVVFLTLLSELFSGSATLRGILYTSKLSLWTFAGWSGLASLFSILKRSDYYLRPLNLWQIIGLVLGVAASVPWIVIEADTAFILAGPIIVAVVCLVKLKWNIRKNKTETSHPVSSNGA
jgi:hypothetical protein